MIMAECESGDASERYEFDAPNEVVDLKELENAESDDKWFGTFLISIFFFNLAACFLTL